MKRLCLIFIILISIGFVGEVFSAEPRYGGEKSLDVDRYGGLEAAITAIGATEMTVVITSAQTLTANRELVSTLSVIVLQGGSIDGAYTLTINGPFEGSDGCFGSSVTVVFGGGAVREVYAEWWGANTTPGTTDMTAIVKSALNSIPVGGTLFFPSVEVYLITGNEIVRTSDITIDGVIGATLRIAATIASNFLINITGATTDSVIRNITLDVNQPSGQAWTNILLQINNSNSVRVENVNFINSDATAFPADNEGFGLYLKETWKDVVVDSCYFNEIAYAVLTESSAIGEGLKVVNSVFEDLGLEGVGINAPSGSANDVLVKGNTFRNIGHNSAVGGLGVAFSGDVGATIENVRVADNYFYSVDIHGVHIEKGVSKAKINNNIFEECGEAAISASGASIFLAVAAAAPASEKITINSNIIIGGSDSDYGILLGSTVAVLSVSITDNLVSNIGNGTGIHLGNQHDNTIITDNEVKNSNGVGININSDNVIVSNNRCYDDDPGTQTYGIEIDINADNCVIQGNNVLGNITAGILNSAPIIDNYVRDNVGWITEARATASLLNGNTSVTVTHGLNGTPNVISIVWTNNPTNVIADWWISDIGAVTFKLNGVDPGASNLGFIWQALIRQ